MHNALNGLAKKILPCIDHNKNGRLQMKDRLKAALLATHPQIKDKMAARYVDKYVAAVIEEIARRHMLLIDSAQ
jgi:hypothetical protein